MYSVQLLPNARGGSTCQIHMPELHASPPSNMSACHDDLHASPRSVASRMAGSRRGDSPSKARSQPGQLSPTHCTGLVACYLFCRGQPCAHPTTAHASTPHTSKGTYASTRTKARPWPTLPALAPRTRSIPSTTMALASLATRNTTALLSPPHHTPRSSLGAVG